MFTLDISATPPLPVVAGQFGLLAEGLGDSEQLIKDIVHQIVRPAIRGNFATEGSRVGGWAPLSEWTQNERGESGPILDRGRGAIGLKYVAQQKNLWTFQRVGLDQHEAFISQADAWSRIPYGVAHQFGYYNVLVGRQVAARPFWVLAPEDVARIEEKTAEWVDRNIKSSIGA